MSVVACYYPIIFTTQTIGGFMTGSEPLKFHTHPSKIPHIFRNRDLTFPANPDLKEWILFAHKHDPQCLKYIYKEQTKYIKFGGGCSYTFERWLGKLFKDTNRTKF